MIVGLVNEKLEATIPLSIVAAGTTLLPIEAVIDTGFSGYLTLPHVFIESLDLEWCLNAEATLGDGSVHDFDVYQAVVLWDGQERAIEVAEAEVDPLVGMSLIQGFLLQIHAVKSGKVQLTPIPLS